MKKGIASFVAVLLLVAMLVTSVAAIQIPPDQLNYTGISRLVSALAISSSGRADCSGNAMVRSGYTADVTVRLKQDGVTIKTWTASGGSGKVSAGGYYYVDSNHNYVVTTTAIVYTSGGSYVEAPSKNSNTVSH